MAIEAKWSDLGSLDADKTLSAVNQLLPRWVTLAIVIAIAWQLARIVWMLMPGPGAVDPLIIPPAQVSQSPSGTASTIDVQIIAGAHLFGAADPDEVVATPQENYEDLAETRLSLSLKGTIASPDSGAAVAIIADNRNEEKVYVLKDTVAPGATLHAIYSDRVILNRGGTLEVLRLPREFPQGTGPVRRATPSANRTIDNTQGLQNVLARNATKLVDVIRPTPYYVSGQMQGYRIYPGRDRQLFASLGLRPGDLVKDIDGAALTNPAQATQIFQELGSKDQVSVTVERNGQPEVIVLNTSQLDIANQQ